MLREPSQPLAKPNDAQWQRIVLLLQSLGMQFDISVERSDVQRTLTLTSPSQDRSVNNQAALILWLTRSAQSLRVRLAPIQVSPNEAWNLIADGFCLVLVDLQNPKASWWVFQAVGSNGIEAIELVDEIQSRRVTWVRFRKLLSNPDFTIFIAEPSLLSAGMSASQDSTAATTGRVASDHGYRHNGHHHGSSVSPVRRVLRFFILEKNDLFSICVFSFFSVALSLATPLTVEVLVNTIGFGRNFQPIFYLALVLAGILFMSSAFKFLQVVVVELLQRRLFVRLVGDLAYRLPQVKRSALQGVHGPELLNRYFDIMTIQKSTATILLDGATIIMQTVIGTLLLAFYHPYLLGFDIILVLCMTIFIYLFGKGGIRTAIQESRIKYEVAHWLQDIIACPTAFKLHSGSELGADRTHRLTVDYLTARRLHFAVLIRQHVFSLFVLVASLTALYALGGYLVVRGQLTLGQLVAAELVVGVIVGAFAKSGKLFESYYDLMSAVDKVGHLIDLPVEPAVVPIDSEPGPISVRAEGIVLHDPATHHEIEVGGFEVDPGESAAIVGSIGTADSLLLPTIAGLIQPARGFIELGGLDARDAIRFSDGRSVGYAGPIEIFQGTVAENIRLGRSGISDLELRQALELVELWDELLQFGNGLETLLQTGGFPLGEDQKPRMMIARAVVGTPRLVLIDWSLDMLPNPIRYRIWDRLRDRHQPWTLIVTTHDSRIINEADKDFRIDHKVTYEPSTEEPQSGDL